LKGLNVTGISQNGGDIWIAGIKIRPGKNNIIEQCSSYGNEGIGIRIQDESEGNLILNCDVYDNYVQGNHR